MFPNENSSPSIMIFITQSCLAYVSWHYCYCYSPKSSFISVRHCIMALSVSLNRRLFRLIRISRDYFSPDRRLFRLAYVSRHYRYFYITVYFGSAKVSRHRYSSHIIKYLIIVAYDTSAIYLSVSEPSSHRILLGKPNDTIRLISIWFGKPNNTSARLISIFVR